MDELPALGTINIMSEDLYFYTAPDGSVTGPATLDQIKLDVRDGMVKINTQVSRGGDHPWVEFTAVMDAIDKGKNTPAPVKAVETKAPAPSQESPAPVAHTHQSPARSGTASALSIIGGVSIFLGAATTLVAFMEAKTMLGAMGLSSLMSGFLFLGFAEALDRLRHISEKLGSKA